MADEKILWCDVKDLFFRGPESNEQVMVSILDPVITVEYHNEHYYIAARFNIETTILHYESHKRFVYQSKLPFASIYTFLFYLIYNNSLETAMNCSLKTYVCNT
jgi:hypothetical protein